MPVETDRIAPRWYVRGRGDSHHYDPECYDFCLTCEIQHERPVGHDWHIESADVDTMICGMRIGLEEGEVRMRPAKNICPRCDEVASKETRP